MKQFTLTISLFFISVAACFAQLPMTRSTYTATYAPLSLPAATLSTATGDDVVQSAIPIGFTFNYLGNNFTTIGLSTNGAASFDPIMSASATNNNLFSTNGPNNTLAPWFDNLWSDTVLYQLQGAPGSQTFTIQWTNSFSYFTAAATQQLNFQIILHETTNEIEFSYGAVLPGTASTSESASIGIEGATGGPGNYLDAVTGSAFTSNGMLNAATEWPSHNFRFTPGAPSAIAAGTYTVGLSGNYFSLSEAVADLNHRGISGAVSLSLIDAIYDVTPANGDNFFPVLIGPVAGSSASNTISIQAASGNASVISEGTANGNCGNAAANNVISNTNEPILSLFGANYVNIQNITLSCSATGIVDRGLQLINSSATAGSQNNSFQGITVMLNRSNVTSIGIEQRAVTTPTAATGTNSNNTFTNLDVSNTYIGIYLNGNPNFPDMNCVVGTSSPTVFNTIGGATANDIGNGNNASYGIRANNQSGVSIFNNDVRNVSQNGVASAEGIVIDAGQGDNLIYMNKVHDLNFTGTNNTGNITGIRVDLINGGNYTAKIYNNFVWNLGSGFNGAPVATRQLRGIYLQSTGTGSSTETFNVDFNNVRIDGSSAINVSSACFQTQSTSPVINVRNNVFANFTPAQTGLAQHFAMASPTTTAIGNTGSVSDYNDLYIANTTNGFIGIGQTTTYATLANWQTGVTQDANSVAVDPGFSSATDLHISTVALNNTANATGITWVNTDIDNQSRSVTPDIGADEFTPLLLDAGIIALVSPLTNSCHSATEQVTVTLKNFAAIPLDFTVNPVTVTVNISGALTQTLTFTVNNNSINSGIPVPVGSTIDVPVGTINMSAAGNYIFDSYTTLAGDGNAVNDTMTTVQIYFSPGISSASPGSVCAGSSTTLTLSGFSAGGSIQWQSSIDNGLTWTNETGSGSTTSSYVVTPSMNTLYQVLFCGSLTTTPDTILYFITTTASAVNDTICGPGTGTVTATGSGIRWYDAASGGNYLASGNSYTTAVVTSTTFYAATTTGSVIQNVGLSDNSAGGGQSASANNLIFDVLQNCTLQGVYVYPAAAGNVVIDLADNTNTVINTVTVAVTAADINQRTFIPVNFILGPGTGMQLQRNPASVNLWRNNVGVNYPYTIPGVLSITSSTAGAGFYYFFYDWKITFGCEGPRVPADIIVTAPVPVSISAGSLAICAGSSTTLTASSTDLTYTYTWSPAAGLNTTTGATVIATPSSSASYVVTGNSSSTGCNATDTVNLTVNALPSALLNASDTLVCSGQQDTISVCIGQNVGLMDNSAGGNMSASINNLIFDVFANCTLNGVYVYPATAGNVIVELQDNTNAVINTATVAVTAAQINQRVWIPLNFNLTPGTGMQLVRNAASVNCWRNNVGVNYPYTFPGVLSITSSTAGAGFYYYFYDWQICTSSANYTFAWTSVPSGFTSSSDTIVVNPSVSTQYILNVTDMLSGCNNVFTQNIMINAPVAVSISGINSICQGDSSLLVATTTGGDGNVTYLWSNSLGTNDSVWVIPSATTTYSVTTTDGCGTVSNATQVVTVNAGTPTASFTYTVTGVNTFSFNSSTSVNATAWSWNFGDTQTSSTQNPVHNYSALGTYTVTLIVSNGCGTDTITQVITVDGVETLAFANTVNIYPNPASGEFHVSFSAGNSSAVTMQLFNIEGKLMQEKQLSNVKQGSAISVNVEGYATGMYMLKLRSENGAATFKILVQ